MSGAVIVQVCLADPVMSLGRMVSEDSQLAITVQYVIRRSQQRNTATFTRSTP